jgi:hypothetical protein
LSARTHASIALKDFQYVQSHIANASTQYGRADLSNHLEAALAESKDANHSLTSTFVLSALNWIPYFGSEIKGASTLFGDASTTATQGIKLLDALDELQSSDSHGKLSNSSLEELQSRVVASSAVLQKLERPVGDLFGPVGRERASFNKKLAHSVHDLNIMGDALTVGRSILGDGGTSTVLVLPENNAEMRDQGAILSYSLMSVHGTTFSVLQSGHSYSHDLSSPLDVPLSPGAKEYFEADGVNQGWRSVNLPANFDWTAATAAAMFKKSTGIPVDDIIALDVPAMAAMLRVTGPLTVPGIPEQLNSQNFETVVLHDLYKNFAVGSQLPRYADLSEISASLLQRIRSDQSDEISFVRALAEEIPGRHLLLWSASPTIESAIVGLGASGRVNTVLPNRTFHVAVESAVAAKLDYYIHVSESYDVLLLPNGGAQVLTTVTLKNDAPTGQAPSYQLGPDKINSHIVGQYVSNIYQWSPEGSVVTGGEPDSGLVLDGFTTSVLPQKTSTTYFSTYIPRAIKDGKFLIHFVPQPRLYPIEVSVRVQGSGWKVSGSGNASFELVAPVTNSFTVKH